MEENKKNIEETINRDCPPHDAAHCDINEHHNLEPGADDCGHTGPGPGPGEDMPKYEGGAPIYSSQSGKK